MRKKSTHYILSLFVTALIFFILNTLGNLIIITVKGVLGTDSIFTFSDIHYSVKGVVFSFSNLPIAVYALISTFSVVSGGVVLFKLRNNFRELETSGLKGTSRFTTLKEIQDQYKSVPEKAKSFKGGGGVPVSRYRNKIYIDDSPVNNLWIGTTRSGKGEMGMFPMIDIYSRAKKPASMVINDPKGELFAASKETLENRGFHVEVLNLDNPLKSMSYQLLQLVIDAYEEGNMAKAEQYTKTISSMLYSDPTAKDKFWQDSASALCTALILGLCEKNIPHHKEKITMYTVASTLNTLASEKEELEDGSQLTGLDRFFDSLPQNHPAKLQYATVKFASGAGQTVAGIFANAFDKLSIFTLTPIAKLTSRNSFDMRKIGFGKVISGHTKPLSRVNIYFSNGKTTVQSNDTGLFTINHDESLDVKDTVTIEVKNKNLTYNIKRILQVTDIDDKTGEVSYTDVTDGAENSEEITLRQFEHFNKPTALFMVTPDYDTSLHVIASLYVKQLYTELARTASNTKGNKCIREVIFILDEFGNMPVINDMGSMITVCLSRNIKFNLVIQAYSQLKQNYDKDWETIDANCANTIYILSSSYSTAEEISKKLGEKTVSSTSRSGSTLSIDKSKTEGVEGRRLLTANELLQLKEGEMVVNRVIKRQDNKRKKVVPYPIFNTGETRMKYRYEYLADWFDTDKSINDFDIECEHANTDLNELVYHFSGNSEDQENDEEHQEESRRNTIGSILQDKKAFEMLAKKTPLEQEDIENLSVDVFVHSLKDWLDKKIISEGLYAAVTEKMPRVVEQQSDSTNNGNDNEQQPEQQTVGSLLDGENILSTIHKIIAPELNVTQEDVNHMPIHQFRDAIDALNENKAIRSNVYNNVVNKIDALLQQDDQQEEEQEKKEIELPM